MTGNFLDRWSRLKRETAQEAKPQPQEPDVAQPSALTAEKIEELVKSLPDVTTLTQDSDFSVFMQSWVPQDLRRDALRRLWTVEKSVLEHVPLADYALDYNTPGMAPGYGPMIASADMVAQVARMMGKAAFAKAETEAADAQPSAPSDAIDDSAASETDGHVPETEEATIESVLDESRIAMIQVDQGAAAAVREDAVQPSSFIPARRRHGAASPR